MAIWTKIKLNLLIEGSYAEFHEEGDVVNSQPRGHDDHTKENQQGTRFLCTNWIYGQKNPEKLQIQQLKE